MPGEDEMDERREAAGPAEASGREGRNGRDRAGGAGAGGGGDSGFDGVDRPEPPSGTVLFERLDGIRGRTLAEVERSSRRRELPRFIAGGAIGLAVIAVAVALVVGAVLHAPEGDTTPADTPTATDASVPASVATANAILSTITLPAGAFSIENSPAAFLRQPIGMALTNGCGTPEKFTRFWAAGAQASQDSVVDFLQQHAPAGFQVAMLGSINPTGTGSSTVRQVELTNSGDQGPARGSVSATAYVQLDFSVMPSAGWGDIVRLDATVLPAGYVCAASKNVLQPPPVGLPVTPAPPDPSDAPIPPATVDDPDAASAPAHAQKLLGSVMLPAGATRVASSPVSYLDVSSRELIIPAGCTGQASAHGFWTVPATSIDELIQFFQTHAPAGFTTGNTFSIGKDGEGLQSKTVEGMSGEWPGSTSPGHPGTGPQPAADQLTSTVAKVSDGVYGIRIDATAMPDGSDCGPTLHFGTSPTG